MYFSIRLDTLCDSFKGFFGVNATILITSTGNYLVTNVYINHGSGSGRGKWIRDQLREYYKFLQICKYIAQEWGLKQIHTGDFNLKYIAWDYEDYEAPVVEPDATMRANHVLLLLMFEGFKQINLRRDTSLRCSIDVAFLSLDVEHMVGEELLLNVVNREPLHNEFCFYFN